MHGLINKSMQVFLQVTYGQDAWTNIAKSAGVSEDGFEPMLHYDDEDTERLIAAAARFLDKPRASLLEDLGTFLVANPALERLRRLLRFGGEDFVSFLHSLDDLPGRARLAVPDLEMPELELRHQTDGYGYTLYCKSPLPGGGRVFQGILAAMADDYGALVLLDHDEGTDGAEEIGIELLDVSFAAGRSFSLAATQG